MPYDDLPEQGPPSRCFRRALIALFARKDPTRLIEWISVHHNAGACRWTQSEIEAVRKYSFPHSVTVRRGANVNPGAAHPAAHQ